MTENIDVAFAGCDLDNESRWYIATAAQASTINEATLELLDVLDTVLACCHPFVRFHRCELTANRYEEDLSLEAIDDEDPLYHISRTIRAEDETTGLDEQDIRRAVEEIQLANDDTLLLSVELDKLRLLVSLASMVEDADDRNAALETVESTIDDAKRAEDVDGIERLLQRLL